MINLLLSFLVLIGFFGALFAITYLVAERPWRRMRKGFWARVFSPRNLTIFSAVGLICSILGDSAVGMCINIMMLIFNLATWQERSPTKGKNRIKMVRESRSKLLKHQERHLLSIIWWARTKDKEPYTYHDKMCLEVKCKAHFLGLTHADATAAINALLGPIEIQPAVIMDLAALSILNECTCDLERKTQCFCQKHDCHTSGSNCVQVAREKSRALGSHPFSDWCACKGCVWKGRRKRWVAA